MLSDMAIHILKEGRIKARVKRAGMLQVLTFEIKRVTQGNISFPELYVKRMIDLNELTRLAKEFGLPVEAENGRAFPEGTGAMDFIGV
jgi:hypothetical protein